MNKKVFGIVGVVVVSFIILLLWQQASFAPENVGHQGQSMAQKPVNIVVLLDLSDRINPDKHPFQMQRDLKIIQNIFAWYAFRVKQRLYFHSRDRFQICIAPQPNDYQELLFKSGAKLLMDGQKLAFGGRPAFEKAQKAMFANLLKIYKRARESKRFVGADIWRFFRDYLSDGIFPHYRNILVILTDGYLDFNAEYQRYRPKNDHLTTYMEIAKYRNRKNWRQLFKEKHIGLSPVDATFPNLEILVLEINLRDIRDRAILEKYWSDWFKQMDVQKFSLKLAEQPVENTFYAIRTFLKREKTHYIGEHQ